MILRTILAYVIVLALGQFGPAVGMVAAAPLSFILLFLPDKIRVSICGFITGMAGSLATIVFAYFVFSWVVGPGSFRFLPIVASVLSLVIPIKNDFNRYLQMKHSRKALLATTDGAATAQIAELSAPDVLIRALALIGNLFGIIGGLCWFLLC